MTTNSDQELLALVMMLLMSDSNNGRDDNSGEITKTLITNILTRVAQKYGIEFHGAQQNEKKQGKERVYGLKGLAELFNVSQPTAQKMKNSGIFDEAMTQLGKKFIWDKEKVLEIARQHGKRI